MLIYISVSLDLGGAGRIQGLSLQLYIKQATISFPIANSIPAVAAAAAISSMAGNSIVQRQNAFSHEVTALDP